MLNHEYALLGGVNRTRIGRWIAITSAAVSACILYIVLSVVDIAKAFGLPVNFAPSVLSLFSAGAIFSVLYWVFDRFLWRYPKMIGVLKVPDLSGDWSCVGQSISKEGKLSYNWEGTVTIVQTWDKIRVRLKTAQSGSNSITAAIIFDEADGYRLLYNYRNDPHIGEVELKSHSGFADILFDKDAKTASGEYFNGNGRFTFGTMHLKRL